MGKKRNCCLPPGALDEIITRLEKVEKQNEVYEGAIRAFFVVFGIGRMPDAPGDGDAHESTSRGE